MPKHLKKVLEKFLNTFDEKGFNVTSADQYIPADIHVGSDGDSFMLGVHPEGAYVHAY